MPYILLFISLFSFLPLQLQGQKKVSFSFDLEDVEIGGKATLSLASGKESFTLDTSGGKILLTQKGKGEEVGLKMVLVEELSELSQETFLKTFSALDNTDIQKGSLPFDQVSSFIFNGAYLLDHPSGTLSMNWTGTKSIVNTGNIGFEVRKEGETASSFLIPIEVILMDSDNDRIPDISDICPNKKGTLENHGCVEKPKRIQAPKKDSLLPNNESEDLYPDSLGNLTDTEIPIVNQNNIILGYLSRNWIFLSLSGFATHLVAIFLLIGTMGISFLSSKIKKRIERFIALLENGPTAFAVLFLAGVSISYMSLSSLPYSHCPLWLLLFLTWILYPLSIVLGLLSLATIFKFLKEDNYLVDLLLLGLLATIVLIILFSPSFGLLSSGDYADFLAEKEAIISKLFPYTGGGW